MTDRSKLLALADEYEALPQGAKHEVARALDDRVHMLMFGKKPFNSAAARRYHASLDAARSLVPVGSPWKVEDHPQYGLRGVVDDQQSFAPTEAGCLVAASLRAQAEALA